MGFLKGIVGVISICKVACMITTVPYISSFLYPNTFLHCLCINNPQITFTDEPRWKIINFQFENLWYLIHSSTTKVKGYRCELSYVFSPDQINLIYQKGFNFQMQSGKKPKKYCSKKNTFNKTWSSSKNNNRHSFVYSMKNIIWFDLDLTKNINMYLPSNKCVQFLNFSFLQLNLTFWWDWLNPLLPRHHKLLFT